MAGTRYTPLALLERLVAFDTESTRSNLPLVDFVTEYLAAWGVPVLNAPNEAGDKAALYATIGPPDRGGVVLSGHTDCVPVAGQTWTSDPFRLRVAEGRAHGRGAVDMKGFDALVLAAVPDMLAAGLATPIHILLSYDEETNCLGSTGIIARFGRDLPRPEVAIVGEPTSLEVVDAHKSVVTFNTLVHGHEAHSAKPQLGANAVMAAGELVAELNRLADEMMARGDPTGRFDPPYTTVHAGRIRGGNARNILARSCEILWEYRGVPGLDDAEIPARFERFAQSVARERLNRFGPFGRIDTVCEANVPGLAPDAGSRAERLALELAGRSATTTAPYATEAGHFQAAGIATVVCGPGSIDSAHQPDEFITLDDLAAGEAFLRRLIVHCSDR